MNEWFRAFGRALGAVMQFLDEQVFIPVQARGANALQDLDTWLHNHHLTLPRLIGYIFLVMAGVALLGGGVAFMGLCIGSIFGGDYPWALTIARALVLVGMVIGLIGFLPVAAMFMFARRFYDLMFHTMRVCAQVFADAENQNIPERLRQQMQQMLEARFSPVPPGLLLTGYFGAYMLLCLIPNLSSIMYVIMAGCFGYITYHLRHLLGVKGWALGHFCYALAVGTMWFATPAYFLACWINKQSFTQDWYSTDDVRFFAQLSFAATVLLLSVWPMYLTTHTEGSDRALDAGDVQRREFKKEPIGLTTDGEPIYELQPRNPWLKWLFFIGTFIGAVVVWTKVLGYGNPFANIGFVGILGLYVLVVLGVGIGLLIFLVKALSGSKHATPSASAQEAHHG